MARPTGMRQCIGPFKTTALIRIKREQLRWCRVTSPKEKIHFLSSDKISEIQHKKYLALYNSLQSDWLTRADRNEIRSKIFKMNFSLSPSQLCSHTPSALNAGAKRSGATCHMAMPQCCYLAKGAKRPSHTTNMKHFFGLVQPKFIFGLVQSKFIFGLVQPKFIFGLVQPKFIFGLVQPKFIFELVQPKSILGLVQPKFIFGLVNSRHYNKSNMMSEGGNKNVTYTEKLLTMYQKANCLEAL